MTNLVYTLSAASVITSLVFIFIPKKDKMLRFAVSVVFIVTVVVPLIYTVPQAVEFNDSYVENTASVFYDIKIKQTEALIADILLKNNIKFKKIYVFANTRDDYDISITKVVIESNDDASAIYAALSSMDFLKVVQKYEE